MENSATPETAQKSNKKIIVLIIFALVTLIGTAAFMMSRNEKDTEDKFLSIEQAKFKSDSLYTEMKKDLAFYKQNNEDLYAQIVEKEEELEKQYVKINRLIGQAQRDQASKKQIEAKLITLSKEISTLNTFVETQTKDIEELRVENKRLKAQKDSLAAAIKATAEQNKKLNNSTAQLSEENKKLNSQIEEASVLQIVNIKAAGLRTRNNGTRVGIAAARRTEIIETCFDVVPNKVTKEGVNRFYLRLMDPSGVTLQDRGKGSGEITSVENERIDYTISKTFDYIASNRSICMEWENSPSAPFVSGTYTIELYNNGRVVGTQNFSMK